ncbi:MAG: hypothetical protein RJR34_11665 [Candidatus Methanoculleus thermohydrogenotrophicum]|nr:hypothetical protein [Candidatus Methanoculleus thermohydrogenotrophicum]
MRPRASHAILVTAALVALIVLAAHATNPVLYAAENISTAAHADPSTIERRSPGDAAAVIPLMDELLSQTGTLTFTIKVKDYESAERDLARYAELSGQFSNLVVKLDLSETDIGEFQRKTRENQESLTALLNDSQRFDDLQRLEIEVLDEDQRMAVIYEGEALRQKMRQGFSAYQEREPTITTIAGNYDLDATPYQESIEHFAEIADAADDWREKTGGGVTQKSPLSITLTPTEGCYGDVIRITGTRTGDAPKTPVEVYVDSRIAANATLDEWGHYACSYRIGQILAGPHLVYATTGGIFSEVRTFEALPQNTSLTLALAEVNQTAVACTGTLRTEGDRAVRDAPIILRVDATTLITTATNETGVYRKEITLPAGEHTIQAEFYGAGFPLNPSESPAGTIHTRGKAPSPLALIAGTAALLSTGWYLRRRHQRKVPERTPLDMAREEEPLEERVKELPPLKIEGLQPRDAATVLFRFLRARLGLAETKTPRDCARLAPAHARFFERYEKIRYAGEVPTEEELSWMEEVARGDQDGA